MLVLLLLGAGGALTWGIHQKLEDSVEKAARKADNPPAPVEVVAIEHGLIELRRTFTGTLEAHAEFVAAPKVSGRVEQLHVDLADGVTRGQVVAVLDDAEYVQAVARARADLEVAKASNDEAASLLKIAARELQRIDNLHGRGLGSESQRDTAKAEQLAKQALVKVTKAQIARAEADLEAARIRLGYTQITAGWRGGSEQRVVGERYVDEGETVAANAPLLRIVELDPITAVFFVTERDYAHLQTGQRATLSTDAFPGETFQGNIQRIAPVFRASTRQAKVELRIANPELRLKPGMFARAMVILARVTEAVIVPVEALTKRNGREGVFLVSADGASVAWRAVQPGIRQNNRVQLTGEGLSGRVVILGQQLLDDGKPIRIAKQNEPAGP
ncbi:MAG: efflux RND transporter periplasmic adaptor subunit [Alphaproteobacteria bacterium]|nr:efflux RND transporter periplasmic adaptor subunit [Alphaproteobacteria bacterium]